MKAIHIACGAGGITLGFEHAGIRTAYAFDHDEVVVKTHQLNFPESPVEVRDIRDIHVSDLPQADVWTCGIPCEPYSIAGQKLGEHDPRDISFEVARLIREARDAGQSPRYVFLENVPPFAKSAGAAAIRESLLGYATFEAILLHANYGIPQMRRRWHIVASLFPPAPVPEPTHAESNTLFGQRPWIRFGTIRDGNGVAPVSVRALRRVFRHIIRNATRYGNAFAPAFVTDDDLLPTVLASWKRGASRNQVVFIYEGGRLRPPSLLEGRRGQGFPDDFAFAGTKAEQWEQVARAVPPPVAEAVARVIVDHAAGLTAGMMTSDRDRAG